MPSAEWRHLLKSRHRQLAGEREPVRPQALDERERDRVPGHRQRPGRRRRSDRPNRPHYPRSLEGELKRDHPAERPAGDESELADPEHIEEAPLGPCWKSAAE
jgi:hypothetical protein